MKFVRVGCFFLVLLVCAAYGVLISDPPETHATIVQASLAAMAKRHELRKPQLKDPKINGYLNSKLGAYFAKGALAADPVASAVGVWTKDFSGQASGRAIDHAALLKAKSVNYLKARTAFGLLMPDLVAAFGAELFRPVSEDSGNPVGTISFPAMSTLAMGLNAFAESLIAEQQYELGALVYQLVFREGWLLSRDAGMVQTFQGITAQALAFQSLVTHLPPDVDLSPSQWAGLSLDLAACSTTPVTLLQSLENDLALGTAYLSQPRADFDGDGRHLRGLYLVPGMQRRDLRIYHNIMGQIIEEAKTGQIKRQPAPDTWGEFFKGSVGSGTTIVLPPDNYRQQSARLILHSAKMSGLALATGIFAYRGYFGKLPKSLADLDRLNLQAPGGSPWSKVTGINYEGDGDTPYMGVAVPEELFALAGINVTAASALEAQRSSYFSTRRAGFVFDLRAKRPEAQAAGAPAATKREASQTGKASP